MYSSSAPDNTLYLTKIHKQTKRVEERAYFSPVTVPVRKISCMKKSWAWNCQGWKWNFHAWNEIFRDENEIFRDENEIFRDEMKFLPQKLSCMKISSLKLRTARVPMKISLAKKSSQEFLPLLRKNLPIDGGAVCPDDSWPTLKISWVVFS